MEGDAGHFGKCAGGIEGSQRQPVMVRPCVNLFGRMAGQHGIHIHGGDIRRKLREHLVDYTRLAADIHFRRIRRIKLAGRGDGHAIDTDLGEFVRVAVHHVDIRGDMFITAGIRLEGADVLSLSHHQDLAGHVEGLFLHQRVHVRLHLGEGGDGRQKKEGEKQFAESAHLKTCIQESVVRRSYKQRHADNQ